MSNITAIINATNSSFKLVEPLTYGAMKGLSDINAMGCLLVLIVFVFFLVAILNKQLNDHGIKYNKFAGWTGGFIGWYIFAAMQNLGLCFLVGVAAAVLVGLFGSTIFGDTESDSSGEGGSSDIGET
jgi:hypothetical protein